MAWISYLLSWHQNSSIRRRETAGVSQLSSLCWLLSFFWSSVACARVHNKTTVKRCLLLSDRYPAECLCVLFGLDTRCWSAPQACMIGILSLADREHSVCITLLMQVADYNFAPTSEWNTITQEATRIMRECSGLQVVCFMEEFCKTNERTLGNTIV